MAYNIVNSIVNSTHWCTVTMWHPCLWADEIHENSIIGNGKMPGPAMLMQLVVAIAH